MGAGYLGKKSMSRWLEDDDNDFFLSSSSMGRKICLVAAAL